MPACPARLRLLSGSCSSARSVAPRFLHAGLTERRSAVRFTRYDQLAGGLPPPSRCPCWAHMTKARDFFRAFFLVPKPRFIPSDGAVYCIPRKPKGVVRDASGPRPTPEAARTPPYGFRVTERSDARRSSGTNKRHSHYG